jgi:putative holliday junction resolvase
MGLIEEKHTMPVVALKDLKTLLPQGMRLMGVDHSKTKIGLALSNPALTMATPLKVITRTKFDADIAAFAAIMREYRVGGIVIGLPVNMDGSSGGRVDSVKHFAINLIAHKDKLGIDPPIAFYDERLTTHAADALLAEDLDMPREKRLQLVDAIAAAHILQDALEALK